MKCVFRISSGVEATNASVITHAGETKFRIEYDKCISLIFTSRIYAERYLCIIVRGAAFTVKFVDRSRVTRATASKQSSRKLGRTVRCSSHRQTDGRTDRQTAMWFCFRVDDATAALVDGKRQWHTTAIFCGRFAPTVDPANPASPFSWTGTFCTAPRWQDV